MLARSTWAVVKETLNDWLDDRAMSLAASLAFYTVLSLAPLLVIAVSIAGLVFGEEAARGQIVGQLQGLIGHDGGAAIEAILASSNKPSAGIAGTVIGAAILFFGASGVFGELQESLNIIWEVKPKPGRGFLGVVRDRVLSFGMVLGVGFLLLVSLLLTAALAALGAFFERTLPGGELLWQVINFAISFGVATLLFALMYKVVPDAKIAWKDVWHGALFTALLFTVGKFLIGVYLGKASVGSAYGAAGSLVVLVVWIYYSSQILFLGAELTHVYARRRGSKIEPTKNASSVHTHHPVAG